MNYSLSTIFFDEKKDSPLSLFLKIKNLFKKKVLIVTNSKVK